MTIVSVDIGNLTTVGVSGEKNIVVESRLKSWSGIDGLNNVEILEFDNEKYIVGDGEFENNVTKYEKGNFFPLLYYTLGKLVEEETVNLIVGIPAGQFSSGKDSLRELILEHNFKRFKINGVEKDIKISEVEIVPESYGLKVNDAMLQRKSGLKTIVIDIGGGTTDVAEFSEELRFTDGYSIKKGLIDIYRATQKVLGDKPYNLSLNLADSKKYFDGSLSLIDDSTAYKKPIMLDFIKNIVNELKGLYPNISNYNVILAGGGCEKIYPIFKKIYPQTIPVSDIKSNCKGFYEIGVSLWR